MSVRKRFIYRSFWPESGTVADFSASGIHDYCFFPANTVNAFGQPYCLFPSIWQGPGVYDFAALEEHLRVFTSVDPQAKFICMVDLNTPLWLTHYRRFPDSFVELGRVSHDETWRRDTDEYFRAVLEYTESRHADRIYAYLLSCGSTSEWFDRSRGAESDSRLTAYRHWCRERGLTEPECIPPASIRFHSAHGQFKDPQEDAEAIRYWRFVNDQNADTLLHFADVARQVVRPEVELGAFFGYIKRGPDRLVSDGHLAYEKVFADPRVDFFVAPAVYNDRAIGGGSGHVVPLGTIQRHGKAFINELDHRTHTANMTPYRNLGFTDPLMEGWPDEPSTIAGIRREFAISLIENTSLWLFDMWGKWFEGENVYATIRQCRTIWDELSREAFTPSAEIALVFDPDSAMYMNQGDDFTDTCTRKIHILLRHSGAPFEEYSLLDLPHIDLSRFKMIIFVNLFALTPAKHELLQRYVFNSDRQAVWLHRAGIIDDGKYDPDHVKKLTGLDRNGKNLQTCKMSRWNSVLIPEPEKLTPAVFRNFARETGVHFYSNEDGPLYANSGLLAVHRAEGGEKIFSLPHKYRRVTELYSGRVVAENADIVTDVIATPGTVLYRLEQ